MTALAARSGVTAHSRGKTVWFTLPAWPEPEASTRHIEFEPEPGD